MLFEQFLAAFDINAARDVDARRHASYPKVWPNYSQDQAVIVAQADRSIKTERRFAMPLVQVKVIEGVFSEEQKGR